MGSPLGPTLADAFLVDFGKSWLQNCLSEFKPYYYRWYVDDIFVLFTSPEHLEVFRNFLNGQHVSMSFTIESDQQNKVSFHDVQLFPEDNTFTTSVYCKPTFSGVFTHFDSFLPSSYKFGTVYTLTYRCFRICSSWTKLPTELHTESKRNFLKKWLPWKFYRWML